MSTHTLATALEPIFAEEGNSEKAVTLRFVKVAEIFSRFPESSINDASDLIKSDEVRRLALGGWLLYTYGATDKNKSAVYKMAQLGKPEAYRSILKAKSWEDVGKAYKAAKLRMAKAKAAKKQEANTSGNTATSLLASASRLDDDSLVFVVNEENDEAIKAMKRAIKRYEAIKTHNKVKAVMEESAPALV
jgi:hypothetical protein